VGMVVRGSNVFHKCI